LTSCSSILLSTTIQAATLERLDMSASIHRGDSLIHFPYEDHLAGERRRSRRVRHCAALDDLLFVLSKDHLLFEACIYHEGRCGNEAWRKLGEGEGGECLRFFFIGGGKPSEPSLRSSAEGLL
jgi:hypothetical protein